MKIEITDESPVHGRSGKGVRFSVTVAISESLGMTTRGFIAFRNEKGELDIKPPISYLNFRGRLVKFKGTAITPELATLISGKLEEKFGKDIKADPDWNARRVARRQQQAQQGWVPDFGEDGLS